MDYSAIGYSRPTYGNLLAYNGDLAAGYFFNPKFGLEFGIEGGPNRVFETTFTNSGGVKFYKEKTETSIASFYAMPQIGIFSEGIFSKNGLHTFGLKIGSAALGGSETDTNLISNASGKVEFESSTITYGFQYRFIDLYQGGLGFAIQVGYDFERFTTITGKNPSGAYAGATLNNPARNPDGSQAFVDASGISLKLVIGGWGSNYSKQGH